jgi:hypothetical protein
MKTAITSGEFAGRLGSLGRLEIEKTMENRQFIDDLLSSG